MKCELSLLSYGATLIMLFLAGCGKTSYQVTDYSPPGTKSDDVINVEQKPSQLGTRDIFTYQHGTAEKTLLPGWRVIGLLGNSSHMTHVLLATPEDSVIEASLPHNPKINDSLQLISLHQQGVEISDGALIYSLDFSEAK